MNFERGLKPTEALDIGHVALAPEISIFHYLDPSRLVEQPDGRLGPTASNVGISRTAAELEKIRDSKGSRKIRFYGFTDEDGEFHRLSEYKGLYVKFEGVSYLIPK